MKKVNKCVLEQLSEMSVRHIEVEPTVKQYLLEKDLELPIVSSLFLNKAKSSCGSSSVSLISSNSSVKRWKISMEITVLNATKYIDIVLRYSLFLCCYIINYPTIVQL